MKTFTEKSRDSIESSDEFFRSLRISEHIITGELEINESQFAMGPEALTIRTQRLRRTEKQVFIEESQISGATTRGDRPYCTTVELAKPTFPRKGGAL